MEEKAQTPRQIQPKLISFDYRRTGMGAISDTILISFKSHKVIKSRLNTSKTGNHGTRKYILFPGKYLAWEVTRSNSGNTYITVKIIEINNEGIKTLQQWNLYEGREEKNDGL